MSEQQDFPQNWRIGQDFEPQQHMMQLKGRDYLNVQSRLLWFIRDQRALIVARLATMPYAVHTEIVEMDREHGYAHFKTYVRDVLGNEATMYGSESAKDFPDFAEKASTKSLGRALLALGYGTAFAPEMDEGERVADSPQERRQQNKPAPTPAPAQSNPKPTNPARPATQGQLNRVALACTALGKPLIEVRGYDHAVEVLASLEVEWKRTHPKQDAPRDLSELPTGASH